jgi:hypothetical protein
MEWNPTWNDPLTRYVAPYHDLIGDKRTRTTFDETVRGIMGAGSSMCQHIAAHSAVLAQGKQGAQRDIRLREKRKTGVFHDLAAKPVKGSSSLSRKTHGEEQDDSISRYEDL